MWRDPKTRPRPPAEGSTIETHEEKDRSKADAMHPWPLLLQGALVIGQGARGACELRPKNMVGQKRGSR